MQVLAMLLGLMQPQGAAASSGPYGKSAIRLSRQTPGNAELQRTRPPRLQTLY